MSAATRDRAAAVLAEGQRQLGRGGGFAGALEPDQENHRRGTLRGGQAGGFSAEQFHQVVMDDLGDLLGRRNALGDLAAHGALAHGGDEFAGDPEVDVGFEQGHADFAQGGVHVVFAQSAAAAEVAEDAGEALGQAFEHWVVLWCEGLLRLYGAPATGRDAAGFRSIGASGLRFAWGIRLAA